MILVFLKAVLSIFIVMDALGNLPIFLSFIRQTPLRQRQKMIDQTVIVAGAVLFLFLFFGTAILSFFSINVSSFKIAGGLILLIFGLKLVLGLRILEERAKTYRAAIIPLATPLITGPGTIPTIIILVNQYGILLTLLASVVNLILTYFILSRVELLHKILGRQGSDALSKIMGLILTAIAVEFIHNGWMGV